MLRYLGRLIRAHPWTIAVVLIFVVLIGTGFGLYGYALYQWPAAQADVKEGRAAQARGKLAFCLFVWPNSTEVHLLAARAARLTGNFDEADAYLKRCIKLERGATEAIQLEYLLMRAQTGEEEEVTPALTNLVDNKHRETCCILETLAGAYMRHLRYGPAYTYLTRWIKEAPQSAKPYHWRGWVLERLNNSVEAMKDYDKALELDPDLVSVRLRVAEMLLENKKPLEALPHLERLRKQAPDRPDVLARLGQCRYLEGKLKEARRLLEAAVQKLPNDPSLLLHLAKLEQGERPPRPAEAEKWLKRALKVDPADTEAQYMLVSSLRAQGREKEARAALKLWQKHKTTLERANKLLKEEARHPNRDPGPPSEIGILLLDIGQERQGLYWLDQALARDPGHRPTRQALADYFEKKGDREKAALHRRWLAKQNTEVNSPKSSSASNP
jgi:tetratricopeptide (TPR) repeat protein